MDFEEVVQKILSTRQDLTREKLLEMIKKKREEAHEFFTHEAAARIVALELGVEIVHKPLQLKVPIKALVSGLNDVTVSGRVVAIYPPHTFTRQDQTKGKFASLVITDNSEKLRVILWDDKTSLVESDNVKIGQTVKVFHGYVREDLNGKLELHVGLRGDVQILPPATTEVPPFRFIKIEKLKPNMRDLDVLARATQIGDVREFKKGEAEVGHVSTLLIKDETGYARLNLWEGKAFLSEEIKPGDIVLAQRAYTRERFGKLSLNLGRLGTLISNPEISEVNRIPPCKEERVKIAEIKEDNGPITVEGTVASTPTMREITTSKDEKVLVVSFDLKDDTGIIGVSAWRRLAEAAKNLTIGSKIEIKNAYVRRGFGDQLELTSRIFTSIKKSPKTEELLS